MDDLPIGTIASINLASPIALSILWERGPRRERSLAAVAPYLRITANPEVIPKKCGSVRIGDSLGVTSAVWFLWHLIVSQGHHRIYSRCAPSRDVACCQRNAHQKQRNC